MLLEILDISDASIVSPGPSPRARFQPAAQGIKIGDQGPPETPGPGQARRRDTGREDLLILVISLHEK